jgi:transcriptional regulator with XRE-family HTH domain
VDAKPLRARRPGKAELRKASVLPILERHGWSILDWANESGVAYHTASDYLGGSTNPYRSTRMKLAQGLGIDLTSLPE